MISATGGGFFRLGRWWYQLYPERAGRQVRHQKLPGRARRSSTILCAQGI